MFIRAPWKWINGQRMSEPDEHVASVEDCTCCDKSDGYGGLYIWEKIEPDWPMIRDRVWTKQATGLPYDALLRPLSS